MLTSEGNLSLLKQFPFFSFLKIPIFLAPAHGLYSLEQTVQKHWNQFKYYRAEVQVHMHFRNGYQSVLLEQWVVVCC